MKTFFYNFPKNICTIFRGRNLFWHLLAILLTLVLVTTGFDWTYFTHVRNPFLHTLLFPAVIIGGLVPLFGLLLFLFWGKIISSEKIVLIAYALGQAAFSGWLISSFYKAFTGRTPPPHNFNLATSIDISHGFHFGFWREGIFWGWPSSHTTVAFAMALALWQIYPRHKWLRYAGLAYAVYIALGVSINIHWFSEAVAGVIFGSLIGTVIGRSFWLEYFSSFKKK